MKFVLAVFYLVLLGANTSAVLDGCFDPPGNSELANKMVSAIEAARQYFPTGIPSLGIPSLDPFGPVPPVHFHIDTLGLRMDGTVNETQIKNLAQFTICSLNATIGLAPKFEVEFRLDNWHMDGKYSVDGLIAAVFPVFGDGDFRLDTYDTGFSGTAKLTYNIMNGYVSIKDLDFDVFFKRLDMEMECINGCGEMSNLINGVISDIGPAVFEAVWDAVEPSLANYLEVGLNYILKNISVSDSISMDEVEVLELGNANDFVDTIMDEVDDAIVSAGLDPAPLPDTSLSLSMTTADLYEGEIVGLSSMGRDGTCSLDKVASWVFLYANLAVENLRVHLKANVTSGATTSLATLDGVVSKVAVYAMVRRDFFGFVTDIDQFVITDFGTIDIDIEDLGVLGFVVEPLTEAVVSLLHEDIAEMMETKIKDLFQDVLGETPWPSL